MYSDDWRRWILRLQSELGTLELAELIYRVSEHFYTRRATGRDPLYLFAALQRHLGYPSVPKSVVNDDNERLPKALEVRLQKIEQKLKILEMETKGGLDLSRFYKPVAVQFLWLVF